MQTLKEFMRQEAEKDGVTITAIFNRIKRGKYPAIIRDHINQRVVYVRSKYSELSEAEKQIRRERVRASKNKHRGHPPVCDCGNPGVEWSNGNSGRCARCKAIEERMYTHHNTQPKPFNPLAKYAETFSIHCKLA